MVGLRRVELLTSSLSGTRSNHLSYRPQIHLTAQQTKTALRLSELDFQS